MGTWRREGREREEETREGRGEGEGEKEKGERIVSGALVKQTSGVASERWVLYGCVGNGNSIGLPDNVIYSMETRRDKQAECRLVILSRGRGAETEK